MSLHTGNTQGHLTEEQFGELFERGTLENGSSAAQAHLQSCPLCRTELNRMREGLALFRETTSAFAEREFARTPRLEANRFVPLHRSFSPGFAWAAAGLLVIATALPLRFRHASPAPQPVPTATASAPAPSSASDEALLDDINREVSASVPASMQALDDPTGSASVTATDAPSASTRKN